MSRIFSFFVCSVLLLLFVAEPQQTIAQQEMEGILREITSPRWIIDQEAQERPTYYELLEGNGTWIPARILFRTGEESLLELTDEQNERLSFLRKDNEIGREVMIKRLQSPFPEYEQTRQAVQGAIPQDDPYFYNASEEQKQAYIAAASANYRLFDKVMDEEVQNTLTPQQMEKVQLLKMQLLPAMGLPSISMFESLGLSDEQKKEMQAIKQEMLPEFDRLVDEAMNNRREHFNAMIESVVETNKAAPLTSWDEINKAMRQGMEKKMADKDRQQRLRENAEKGQKFATRFRDRLMNVLTDEQLDRMQQIMDEAPDFVKRRLQESKQQREAMEKSGQYQPGPDSWRPGDGLPRDFKAERREKRFPGKK